MARSSSITRSSGRDAIPVRKKRTTGSTAVKRLPPLTRPEARLVEILNGVDPLAVDPTALDAAIGGNYDRYATAYQKAFEAVLPEIRDIYLAVYTRAAEETYAEIRRDTRRMYEEAGLLRKDTVTPEDIIAGFRFDAENPAALRYAETNSAKLVTNTTSEGIRALRVGVQEAYSIGHTPSSLQRTLYNILNDASTFVPTTGGAKSLARFYGVSAHGLTVRYEQAVLNFAGRHAEDLARRGITGTKAIESVTKKTQAYADKLRRARSRTIARTELSFANNASKMESMNDAVNRGLVSKKDSRKQWTTSRFDVCQICGPLNGQAVPLNGVFAGRYQHPPAHPNCRCTIQLLPNIKHYQSGQPTGLGTPASPHGISTPAGGGIAAAPELPSLPIIPPLPPTPTPPPPEVRQAGEIHQYEPARHDLDWFQPRASEITDDLQRTHGMDWDISGAEDRGLLRIWQEQGFDQRPALATADEWETLLGKGYRPMYRGITADTPEELAAYLNQFTVGDAPFAGRGLFGGGTYTTDIRATAESFAREAHGIGQAVKGEKAVGEVIDMALHPDAKVIDIDDLHKMRDELVARRRAWERAHLYDERIDMYRPWDSLSPEIRAEAQRWNALEKLAEEDLGRFASMMGYDAIRIPNPVVDWQTQEALADTYYAILNRGAVIVKTPSGATPEAVAAIEELVVAPAAPLNPDMIDISDLLPKVAHLRDIDSPLKMATNPVDFKWFGWQETDEAAAAMDAIDEIGRRIEVRAMEIFEEEKVSLEAAVEAIEKERRAAIMTHGKADDELSRVKSETLIRRLETLRHDAVTAEGVEDAQAIAAIDRSIAKLRSMRVDPKELADEEFFGDLLTVFERRAQHSPNKVDKAAAQFVKDYLFDEKLGPTDGQLLELLDEGPPEFWRQTIRDLEWRKGTGYNLRNKRIIERLYQTFESSEFAEAKAAEESARLALIEVQERMKEARKAVKRAFGNAVDRVLRATREGYGTATNLEQFFGKIVGKGDATKKVIVERLRTTIPSHLPKEWVDSLVVGGNGHYSLGWVERGFFDKWAKKVRLSGTDWEATLQHELQHGVQAYQSGVHNAERLFYNRRAVAVGGKPEAKAYAVGEHYYDLELGDAYAAKVYPSGGSEITTRGMEMLFYEDPFAMEASYRRFMIGILAGL